MDGRATLQGRADQATALMRAWARRGGALALVACACAALLFAGALGPWHDFEGRHPGGPWMPISDELGSEGEELTRYFGALAVLGAAGWLVLPRGWRVGRWAAFGAFEAAALTVLFLLPETVPVLLGLGGWSSRLLGGTRAPCPSARPGVWCDQGWAGVREVVGWGAGLALCAATAGLACCIAAVRCRAANPARAKAHLVVATALAPQVLLSLYLLLEWLARRLA